MSWGKGRLARPDAEDTRVSGALITVYAVVAYAATQATFQQQQAEREGQAVVAQALAEARVAEVKAAQERTLALQKAQGDADQARIGAESEAARMRTLTDAEAISNQAHASSLTPVLVEYERWRRWDGKLPQTVLGTDPAVQLARYRTARGRRPAVVNVLRVPATQRARKASSTRSVPVSR